MDHLDDELDLRYHRKLKPEVYYRCPTLESLDGAIRNELEKNALSLIPVEIVTEFVFAVASTITIPVTQQPHLDNLFEPADYAQSITVDLALCRHLEGKGRLKAQRAIARSFIEKIEEVDGFKYAERQAWNKDSSDGLRFKYVCIDSLQNRDRKSNLKKNQDAENGDDEEKQRSGRNALPAYDCGGAIHVKFSIKREAVNVIYVHNPIHRDVESRPVNGDSQLPVPTVEEESAPAASNGNKQRKRRRSKKSDVDLDNELHHPDLDMSTSPEPATVSKKKRRKSDPVASPSATRKSSKKSKKAKQTQSPSKSRRKSTLRDPSPEPPPKPVKGTACLRCKQKAIKCNQAKPTCNQCARGLWTCQYETTGPKPRSKNGCINCKQRKRKCTEEKPSCAYCLKIDDDCAYADLD
ncbi:hypothetical protein BS50DRAFT_478435 [Corynespora cassiicola Philippines]|uniref:Zn(2)-C6 fungal-type domain-containing protein n=1 Tax=Corynespora cassiicola Philippines TaxID=1448308 RepID=A0A2T2P8H3_CORCC|nr:hypothetical protein BS50DRAFT_478435 [Corynespora cassiicola Philippines]